MIFQPRASRVAERVQRASAAKPGAGLAGAAAGTTAPGAAALPTAAGSPPGAATGSWASAPPSFRSLPGSPLRNQFRLRPVLSVRRCVCSPTRSSESTSVRRLDPVFRTRRQGTFSTDGEGLSGGLGATREDWAGTHQKRLSRALTMNREARESLVGLALEGKDPASWRRPWYLRIAGYSDRERVRSPLKVRLFRSGRGAG